MYKPGDIVSCPSGYGLGVDVEYFVNKGSGLGVVLCPSPSTPNAYFVIWDLDESYTVHSDDELEPVSGRFQVSIIQNL